MVVSKVALHVVHKLIVKCATIRRNAHSAMQRDMVHYKTIQEHAMFALQTARCVTHVAALATRAHVIRGLPILPMETLVLLVNQDAHHFVKVMVLAILVLTERD
jgi:hypothetical protein